MEREAKSFAIRELKSEFARIEFPEYQREPTVWSRDQKQRLIDSILRHFDIAAIYLYARNDGGWECIDGRQRLNAIMSFLGVNEADDDDGFSVRIHNEVTEDDGSDLGRLDGRTFAELEDVDRDAILDYQVITVVLSGSRAPEEFNLQFLRLNLGTLINAGEKLHAMVGVMRDLLFESERLGRHPFLARVRIPTRRYAHELIAAQLMLQVSSKAERDEFARARHFDLQRYLKLYADHKDPHVDEVVETLDALEGSGPEIADRLGNRAICVSVALAAWDLEIRADPAVAEKYSRFVGDFLERLAEQVARMKEFDIDRRYDYLVEFQRNLTQAAVERPAIEFRHRTLLDQFATWSRTGHLRGDSEA
ncbi:MAG: hypothetical protein QOJ38_153 [Solirubrobacterales bacterium]|jgi:hypothetical protein|nr:hypothetical protein [Solirubrobacterales bacterium]